MDLLDRLHESLLAAHRLRGSGRDLTIGDIYQQLIPYRSIRAELGIWELAQYEQVLLRLLSGERGYVAAPAQVQQELGRELRSPNPILGIYRDYAATPVDLGSGTFPTARAVSSEAPLPGGTPSPSEAPPANECRSCHSVLPDVEHLRYCPLCGSDQQALTCPGCDTPMRAEWRFCVRCGNSR